jgi:hypothetical protein
MKLNSVEQAAMNNPFVGGAESVQDHLHTDTAPASGLHAPVGQPMSGRRADETTPPHGGVDERPTSRRSTSTNRWSS